MDNVGFTLHVALFLAYFEKYLQNNDVEIDTLYLTKKIIFTSLADLILSDINSGTKEYIKRTDTQIFSKLYQKAFDDIYSFWWPDFLLDDMRETLEDTTHPLEDLIITAAKKYVWFTESETNARVFAEMYEVPVTELRSSLRDMSKQLVSLEELLKNTDFQKYLSHIQRLSFAVRWNQYQRVFPISVMSHKVVVAYLSYVIWMYMNHEWQDNDIMQMMMRAIYHDVPEVITGDIITPTKKAVPGFTELLETVETDMVEDYLFSYIPKHYQQYISSYMLEPFDGELWAKVKYADNLSAFSEAQLEDIAGNKNFTEMTQRMKQEHINLDNPAVSYILEDMERYFSQMWEDTFKK